MQPTTTLRLRKTYLAVIRGSVDSTMFRHLYANVDGVEKDILDDGLKSCAYYVSFILCPFNLLQAPHATVKGLRTGLLLNGWTEVSQEPREGEVVVWEEAAQAGGEMHFHAGFCMGDGTAISHVDRTRTPQEHHLTFGLNEDDSPKRKIISVYTHSFLG